MLSIEVSIGFEGWDEKKQEFVIPKKQILHLEHSLVSISKWESKIKKPFFSKEEKTYGDVLEYIKFMTLTQNVKPEVYDYLTEKNIKDINDYIEDPMTATTFRNVGKQGGGRGVVTSELIYYWMIKLNIPKEFEKWHINRLLTLIRIFEVHDTPAKKMSKSEIMRRNSALNEARKRQFNTRG